MKKRERKTRRRFKATANSQSAGRQPEELEPEELAVYVRRAEKNRGGKGCVGSSNVK